MAIKKINWKIRDCLEYVNRGDVVWEVLKLPGVYN